ncbi:MAG: type II secretion system ATPase GspE [Myxococcota bacterium]|nr:type II secretion system ATPase GspE [Myxococcota bacterium]
MDKQEVIEESDQAALESASINGASFSDDRLSELFVSGGLVEASAMEEVNELMAQREMSFRDVLLAQKLVTEVQYLEVLGGFLGLRCIPKIVDDQIPDDLINGVPINFCKQYKLLPLTMLESGAVRVACAEPDDVSALDDLSVLLGAPLDVVLAASNQIMTAINFVYDRGTAHAAAAMEEMSDEDLDTFAMDIEEAVDLLDAEDEAPIIRLVNSLLSQASKESASDIHIEPGERDLVVRFRIDGILYEKIRPPKKLQASITSRIKIQAGLNIAEKRLPQDGRIRIKLAGKDIDIRVATAPTSYGERITMRLLERSSVLISLGDLGFVPENHAMMSGLIRKSHGIILVTGPTGSGKTTSLYACLSEINRPDLNILTIEDPVEYQLKGISQTQVNHKIGLSFAGGLRSFLRHDPDVIMVGEIRDLETAEIAIQAALTGHLVLSTIHTNDAAGAITRLVDMGVEPFLVASSVIGILAQRLVRTLCPDCKEQYEATDEEVRELGLSLDMIGPKPKFWRGVGCKECFDTGYQGRIGIYEMLNPTDEVRKLILENVDSNSIKYKAKSQGMRTLREDGAQKVLAGLTSSAEVLRVTTEV